ncbi:MAG: hypothetical protein KAJ28_10030 [Flavobacteriaceae bacterium]|nr:hypothetical protein [Flavobacteriaceae bacterium]
MRLYAIFLIILFLSYAGLGYSQTSRIELVQLKDSVFLKGVSEIIKKAKIQYPPFKDKGYIQVYLNYLNKEAVNEQIFAEYRVNDQYFSLKLRYTRSLFPKFYSYIDGKIILIYNKTVPILNLGFSKRSKRRLIKKMEPFLSKKEHLIARDNNGKIIINDKSFRPNESFKLHGGWFLKIYANGKYDIEKKKY